MPKRKRDEAKNQEQSSSHITDKKFRLIASRFKAHFENGVKTLTGQIKLARGFDRQKMTRRMKQASSDPAKLDRLQAELSVLKDFDAAAVAENYLLKQCIRTNKIRESPGFIAVFGEDGEAAKAKRTVSIAESNVLGRLFKSTPVTGVLPKILRDIRTVLGVDELVEATDITGEMPKEKGNGAAFASEESEEFGGFSDSPADDGDLSGLEVEDDGTLHEHAEELLNIYQERLAASSDSESESEADIYARGNSMSITSEEENTEAKKLLDHGEDFSNSNHSASEDGEPTNSTELDQQSNTNAISKSTSTRVLPALMNGGYYSGSESASDFDPDQDMQVNAMMHTRKNRRGQRARQAIAEMKHGTGAKHLLKVNDAKRGQMGRERSGPTSKDKRREIGWDPRRGAVAEKVGRTNGKVKPMNRYERTNGTGRDMRSSIGSSGTSRGRSEETPGSNTSAKPLHPSWEAAKKKKLESGGGGANFAGKKIIFD